MDIKPVESASLNPLARHFRQPAIYFKLPSLGKYWPENSLEMPVTGELPVFPMTARDEVTLRTPDALLNGQGIIDVIQSCIPNIKNAWNMPSVDVDACLIAVRIASYGNNMDVDTKCPHCGEEHSYGVDLGTILSSIKCPDYSKKFETHGMKIKLTPQTYFSANQTDQIRFEQQRVLQTVTDDSMSDELKMAEYTKHLQRIVDLNVKLIVDSTEYIEIEGNEIVVDKKFIEEFYNKCETQIIKDLQEALAVLLEQAKLIDITAKCNDCTKEFTIPLAFDYASFFDVGS